MMTSMPTGSKATTAEYHRPQVQNAMDKNAACHVAIRCADEANRLLRNALNTDIPHVARINAIRLAREQFLDALQALADE
jgi:hypothetical protein